MRRIVLLLLFAAASAYGQERLAYPRPDPSRFVVMKETKYHVYRPAGNDVVPVVIFANIGAAPYQTWTGYIGWAEATAANGLAAVLYQATDENAVAGFDALVAVLRERAAELRIDASRIVVFSASANVKIGLPIAMDPKREYIRAAVVYYGDGEVAQFRYDIPLLLVRAGLDNSALNRRIDALIGRALAANAPWAVESHASAVHGFDVLSDDEVSRQIVGRTLAFMKDSVRLSPAYASLADRAIVGGAFNRGDWQTAIAGYRRAVAADDKDAESHRRLGLSLLETKQYADALTELERAWELGRRGPRDTGYPAAQAAAGARNVDRTVHWLNVILSTPFGPPLEELRTSEAFAGVRDEPAYRELLAKFEKRP